MATEQNKLPTVLTLHDCAEILRVSLKTMQGRAKAGALKGCTGGNYQPYRVDKVQFFRQHNLTLPS